MEKIYDILLKYKTDKNMGAIKNIYKDLDSWEVCENPEPMIGHTYGKAYDMIFESFDRNSELDILEIGIQRGGSMCAWKDYFKNANIYGVDIKNAILTEYFRDEFTYIFNDIKSKETKEKLKNNMFDIIIDDGSHILSDVIFVIENYTQNIKNNGVLIIEDCQHPEYWLSEIQKIIPNNFDLYIVDLRNDTEYSSYDNYIILLKRN